MGASTHEKKAPESVGWYIELTKWLIGTSAAVLVFGFDKVHVQALTGWLASGFWLSSISLSIAAVAGIFACMQLLAYANRLETGTADGETDASIRSYRTRGTIAYQICSASLIAGIALFAVTWAGTLLAGIGEESGGSPVIITLPDKASAVLVKPPSAGARSAILSRNKDGEYVWQIVTAGRPAGSATKSLSSSASSTSSATSKPH